MTIENLHKLFLECDNVATDTRKIKINSMFFALTGANFDGNIFAKQALVQGARYVIIDNDDYKINKKTIVVTNVLNTLQALATYHRNYLKTPIIALTGSNGKTTTKELINAVLSKKYNTTATIGNLNNHIGVPLTLLSFTKKTEIGIVEMGANHQKEIAFLCNITQPDYGYITNFGKAHLEGFGGVAGVIKGKSEMYDYLRTYNKIAFINIDDALQIEKSKNIKTIGYSANSDSANLYITDIDCNPLVTITLNKQIIQSNLIGLYNATNICAAIAIGQHFKVTDQLIKEAIENYIPDNNRSQMINKNGNEIILDAYNANPSSMKVAIENFLTIDKKGKIIIIGDMFELGDDSLQEHKEIINMLANQTEIDRVFVGNDFFANKIKAVRMHFFIDFDQLAIHLKNNLPRNNFILIKGSRGMALERVLEVI